MRTDTLTTGGLAAVAATALIGLSAAVPAEGAPAGPSSPSTVLTATSGATQRVDRGAEATVEHQRGIVVECTGALDGRTFWTSIYENNLHGNTVQVTVLDEGVGGSHQTTRPFLHRGKVHAGAKVDGRLALITGKARPVGKRTPVHEVNDDAGFHIVTDGFHRRLRTRLTLAYGGKATRLACDTAFAYALRVTKTPIAG